MKLYLAESGAVFQSYLGGGIEGDKKGLMKQEICQGEMFNDVFILQSFFYCNDFTQKVILPSCKDFLLDSGAFTFMQCHKSTVDWDEYIRKYAKFIKANEKIDKFFELDIDSVVGYERVKEYRKKLEYLTGKKCIPVWHKSRGKDEFLKMCEEYPYVAIGGIVTKEITRGQYPFFDWFINEAHKRNAKIHGLGFTNLEGLKKYHFDSVDSTSWTTGNRFGAIYQFNGETMIKHSKKEGQRLADSKKTAIHNFAEWVKFQKYAETNL